MDDKGSTMIVVFGLPPTSHEDDAARAVLCAQQIYKSLSNLINNFNSLKFEC